MSFWVSILKAAQFTQRMIPLVLFTKQSDCFLHVGAFKSASRSQYNAVEKPLTTKYHEKGNPDREIQSRD